MTIEDLKTLGLNGKQAKVYLACLELGQGSSVTIAQRCRLPKSTTNDVLRSLVQMGLATSYLKKTRKRYTASDPHILKEQLARRQDRLTQILPELAALYGQKHSKLKLRFFEGKDGLGLVLKEALEEADEIITINSVEDIHQKLNQFWPHFAHERAKHKIPIRVICHDSPMARQRKLTGPSELRRVKIKQTSTPVDAAYFCWKNKLVLITLKEDFMVVMIESEDIAKTFRLMFDWLWHETPEIK